MTVTRSGDAAFVSLAVVTNRCQLKGASVRQLQRTARYVDYIATREFDDGRCSRAIGVEIHHVRSSNANIPQPGTCRCSEGFLRAHRYRCAREYRVGHRIPNRIRGEFVNPKEDRETPLICSDYDSRCVSLTKSIRKAMNSFFSYGVDRNSSLILNRLRVFGTISVSCELVSRAR